MRKASLKELCSLSKIEQKDLTTTFHVERRIVQLKHVKQFANLFAHYYNKEVIS